MSLMEILLPHYEFALITRKVCLHFYPFLSGFSDAWKMSSILLSSLFLPRRHRISEPMSKIVFK